MKKPEQGSERVAALASLNEDQRKRLAAFARVMAANTGEDWNDFLQEAFVRWLDSKKPVEGPEQTYSFLAGAIRSIRSNKFRHDAVVLRYDGIRTFAKEDGEEDPINLAAAPGSSPDEPLRFQQLYDLFAVDGEIQLLLLAQMQNLTPAEIQDELGWDEKKYGTVLKRKRRLVTRWTLEGKLQ